MNINRILASILLVGASAAHAILIDDFDSNVADLNATPIGWTVTDGTVDIIGNGFNDLIPFSGLYIDLDGSTSDSGLLQRAVALNAGVKYRATFDLAGNQRQDTLEAVTVTFGDQSAIFSLPYKVVWTPYSLIFTPGSGGSYVLSFENTGGDNVGMLLDNVEVAVVPEPQTYALLALGLVAVSASVRRRKATAKSYDYKCLDSNHKLGKDRTVEPASVTNGH